MATTARPGTAAGQRALRIESPTRDRPLLRDFLERDRLRAAYALCDLEDREFAQYQLGSGPEPAMNRSRSCSSTAALTPQPLFVMGDADGIVAVLREVIRPRLVYLAADAALLPAIGRCTASTRGRRWCAWRSSRETFAAAAGPVAARLVPADIVDLNRLYGLGFSGWLPPESIANGVYYGVRIAGRLVAAAGTHVISPRGAPRRWSVTCSPTPTSAAVALPS